MELTRKYIYVSEGHLTNTTLSMTYEIMISLDSVGLSFLIAVLNDLYILAGDIHNAYLNSPKKEKYFYTP